MENNNQQYNTQLNINDFQYYNPETTENNEILIPEGN